MGVRTASTIQASRMGRLRSLVTPPIVNQLRRDRAGLVYGKAERMAAAFAFVSALTVKMPSPLKYV